MITVVGMGFVGLTTALGFAHFGQTVYGLESQAERKAALEKCEPPFLEPHFREELSEHLNQNFFLTDRICEAVEKSECIFYCVGTPCGENGEADLSALFEAIRQTVPYMNQENKPLLIIKSTVPPGSTQWRIFPFLEELGLKEGENVLLANNPEFLREGHCWEDFVYPDRIVAGTSREETARRIQKLYEPFQSMVKIVSWNTAEFIKYLSNSLLATMISFSNEMANAAERIGDIQTGEAFRILHMDKRWNGCNMSSYVYPGCGYGGYCLPKDTKAMKSLAECAGAGMPLLSSVIATNEGMAASIAGRIAEKTTPQQRIGVMGLSFKPHSNDVRDCASFKIMLELIHLGYQHFAAYDPAATEEFISAYHLEADYCNSLEELCEKSDVMILLTAWPEFQKIHELTDKPVLDYRYVL